jgi:aspartate ammonia-lyase
MPEGMRYWGPETEKALINFGSGHTPRRIIAAYAQVKLAALTAAQETEARFSPGIFACIEAALLEIAAGALDASFPLPIKQGGAGTSLNMNLNEVAAARAEELCLERSGAIVVIDPFEDMNRRQSTNDTFPTAVTILAYEAAARAEALVARLQEALAAREREFELLLLAGRTELQDALPIRLGQVFGAWAGAVERDRWRLSKLRERLRTVALGGTAIGTGFSATPAYMHAAEKALRRITRLPLSRSQNLPDEVANADKYAELAGAAALCAGNARKIASDLLLYGSSAFGELRHPELQYGSTIMPAKANPVLLEAAKGRAIDAEQIGRASCRERV